MELIVLIPNRLILASTTLICIYLILSLHFTGTPNYNKLKVIDIRYPYFSSFFVFFSYYVSSTKVNTELNMMG